MIDPISWLSAYGLQLFAFAACLFVIYKLWPVSPGRKMRDTFTYTQLYLKKEKWMKTQKVYPKLHSLETKDWGYIFKYEVPPGLSFKHFTERKPFIDVAFGGECDIKGKANIVTIEVMTRSLPNFVQFEALGMPKTAARDALPLVLGYSKKGVRVMDLTEIPHVLVTGESGTGKSMFIRQMLTNLVLVKKPDQLQLTLFDLKNGLELSVFEHLPHVICFNKDFNNLDDNIKFVRGLLNERGDLLETNGVPDIQQYNAKFPNNPLPLHIVVIDELSEITDFKWIERIVRRGRAYGVHLVLVTQRADIVKFSFPMVVKFRYKNGINKLPLVPGRAKIEFNGECDIQGFHLSKEQARNLIEENTLIRRRRPIAVVE